MRIRELQKQSQSPDIDMRGLEQIEEQIRAEAAEMERLQAKYVQMQQAAYKAGQGIGSAIRGIGTGLKGLLNTGLKGIGGAFKGIATTGVNALKGLGSRVMGIGSHVTSLGSKILSLAKGAFIFNMLSNGLRSMANAAKNSFGEYLNYDASLKRSVTSLKASLNGLGGQLASAFAPILSVVVPMLSTLVNWCVTAANAVAAFIAAITGKSTYKVAVAGLGDVASGAGGAAGGLGDATDAAKKLKKELSGFDELNVINKDTASSAAGGSGGGGGGGGGAGGITYTDADVSSAISDFAEKVKEAWKNADFTEIGGIIGEKLKGALDSIPWGQIQETAKKVAKSLATLINGFVETEGLGDTIGKTIAEAINTGILSLGTFARTLKWDSVGKFIADQINGALTRFNWSAAITAASSIGGGIATALNRVITSKTFSNLGSTVANAINTAISGAYSFFTTVDWSGWGRAIASGANSFFLKFDWKKAGLTLTSAASGLLSFFTNAIKETDWRSFGEGVADMIRNIDWGQLLTDVANLVTEIFKGLLDFGAGLFDPFTMSEWHKEIQGATKELETANKEIKQRLDDADKWDSAGDAESRYLQTLATEYSKLYEKENLTTSEKERMKQLAGELVGTLPELEKYYNKESGLIETTQGKLDALIEAYKAKARTEAMQDALKGYYTAQADANQVIEKAEANVKSLKDEEERRRWIDEKLTEQLIALQEEQSKYGMEIPGIQEKITELTKKQDENTAAMEDNKKLQDEQNSVIKDAKAAYDQAQAGIDAITRSYTSLSSETSEATGKTKELSHELDLISKNSKITIEATLQGLDVTMQDKIDVIAEVTGVDYTGIPVSEKVIDDMYGQIVETYTKGGFTPQVDMQGIATSMKDGVPADQKHVSGVRADATGFTYGGIPGAQRIVPGIRADATSFTYGGIPGGKRVVGGVRADANGFTYGGIPGKARVVPGVRADANSFTYGSIPGKLRYVPGVQARANDMADKVPGNKKYINKVTANVNKLNKTGGSLTLSGNVRTYGNSAKIVMAGTGGIFSHGRWANIAQYAVGGAPSHGTLFAAGENGAEIVGKIGGRTEVLNKSQIASAIFSAVSTAINVTLPHIATQIIQSNATIASMISGTLHNLTDAFEAVNIPQANIGITDTNRVNSFREAISAALEIDRAATNAQYAEILNRLDSEEYRFTAQLDGRTIFDEMVNRNQMYRNQTGRTAF